MNYEYHMVQIPVAVVGTAGKGDGGEAAKYLEQVANREAEEGWEFLRIDEMNVTQPPGCFSGTGQPQAEPVFVMTFRRERAP